MILPLKCDNQNASYPSTIFKSSRKARMPGRRPLDSRRTLKTPLSRNSLRIRCAVGVGMFFCDVNSDVSKTGRRKRKSSAWIATRWGHSSARSSRGRCNPKQCPPGTLLKPSRIELLCPSDFGENNRTPHCPSESGSPGW